MSAQRSLARSRQTRAAVWSILTALALAGVACTDLQANPITAPYTSAFSGGRGVDAGLTSKRNPPIACPHTIDENSPCPQVGGVCEFGTSADSQCNTVYVCAADPQYGDYWTEQSRGTCGAVCPASSAIVEGAPCDLGDAGSQDELLCTTPQGTCGCTTGPDGAHAHARMWVCTKPADGCPDQRPLLGQPCVGDIACDYGSCVFKDGWRMICEDEVWQTEEGQCAK